MTGYRIPTFAMRKTLRATRTARAARRATQAAIARADNDSQLAQALGELVPSVVGHCRTIQADRKDYLLMLGYLKARMRENAREES